MPEARALRRLLDYNQWAATSAWSGASPSEYRPGEAGAIRSAKSERRGFAASAVGGQRSPLPSPSRAEG
jgi:hypothetical protein